MSLPSNRIIEKTVGCWNCKHWAPEAGAEFWMQRRRTDLAIAKRIALESRKGEADVRVENIKKMVVKLDMAMAATPPLFGLCLNAKAKEQDRLGDLVASAFLCSAGWSGATGASLARAGAALDKTAAEIIEDLDGTDAVKEQGLIK